MTPDKFIAKWRDNTRNEQAAYVEHFTDLCRLVDEPTPNEADRDGLDYAFQKQVTKTAGTRGFADVWKRGHFAMEYKGRGANFNVAFDQLQRYALGLDSPPLLVVCDLSTLVIRTAWTGLKSETHTIELDDLADPRQRRKIKWMLSEPEALRPSQTREQLTIEAAEEIAKLAASLRRKNQNGREPYPADKVAHFVNRIVFCLFADRTGLLPHGLVRKFLDNAHRQPVRFRNLAGNLFRAMRDGSDDFLDTIDWFNGGLFDDDWAPALTGAEIFMIQKAARRDWAEIEPSIFGTLFERYLDPEKEKQIGAHYTDAAKIALIVEPCITRPLRAEWDAVKPRIAALMAEVGALRAPLLIPEDAKGEGAAARRARAALAKQNAAREAEAAAKQEAADALLESHLARLRAFRVLDPACGSGNFLYVSLIALKDLERAAILEAEAMGLPGRAVKIGPEVVHGFDINGFAVELARVSVWIGALQWTFRNGQPVAGDPILKPLATIDRRDALLNEDGTPAEWPPADAIVGNPPWVGDKFMLRKVGEEATQRIRAAYAGRVPGGADLVCYWFEKGREALAAGRATRVGLVSTQSIRKGANRKVLDRICETGVIFDAWDDEPWTLDGAAVRASMVCFAGRDAGDPVHLDGQPVPEIQADLTARASELITAVRLVANRGISFQGPVKVGAFDVDGQTARNWLAAPANPSGVRNSDVVRPHLNGRGLMQRAPEGWIVDLANRTEAEAAEYVLPFAHVVLHVKPDRLKNRDPQRRTKWWLFGRSSAALRTALAPLPRYIITPETARRRVFAWCHPNVLPEHKLYAIARDDDTTFGILHSRFHEAWTVAMSSRHGVGNDVRYTNTRCFETFPFPEGLTPDRPATSYAGDARANAIATAARDLVEKRDAWLNPPDWVERVPEIVPGYPDRILPRPGREKLLKARTLTALYNTRGTPEGAWLDALHATLDAAVAAAYGWPADIPEEDALARLLALNLARATAPAVALEPPTPRQVAPPAQAPAPGPPPSD